MARQSTVARLLATATVLCALVVWPGGSPAVRAASEPARRVPDPLWFVPVSRGASPVASPLATAIAQLADGHADKALPVFTRATSDPALGGYALLYMGRAQLALDRPADAGFSAGEILKTHPIGNLRDAALVLDADAAEASGNWPRVVQALRTLAASTPLNPERALLRLGRAAVHTSDLQLAYSSFAKIYYDHPLSPDSDDAAAELAKLVGSTAPATPESVALDFARAEKLYAAGRYADARKAFVALRPKASAADRAAIDLRLAECDYSLKHYFAARDALQSMLEKPGAQQTEAEFFYLSTLAELGRIDEYVARARAFVAAHSASPLAGEVLNDLGTHYVLRDDDGQAAQVFADLYRMFPAGAHADRAAWRAGWWAYKHGDFAETVRTFEAAAATPALRPSNFRPTWLYWAAKARARIGDNDATLAAYNRVIADYRNTYYGRLAMRERDRLVAAGARDLSVVSARQDAWAALPPAPPATAGIIRSLLSAGLYDDAIAELQKAQIESGTSPAIEATIAYAQNRKGELRLGIIAMRKAYPQFLADGGEALPPEVLAVIFPVAYWDLVQKYAVARQLDPYMMAALIVQESTYEADARSTANAWGLMQIVPSTGRQYAQSLGIKGFRTSRLTDPETNIRIGMAYFSDLVKQFGGVVPALAAYNAGEQRAARWLAERPGVDQDEFIDDIPFPETQGYVRRILGQSDDYRRLYRDLKVAPAVAKPGR